MVNYGSPTTDEYRNIAIQPSGIDVSSDGHIYIAQNGNGLVKIQYDSFANNNNVADLIITENTPFQNLYKSSNTITTQGSVIIQSNQRVVYCSNSITLNQNFSVEAGADFEVRNDVCD